MTTVVVLRFGRMPTRDQTRSVCLHRVLSESQESQLQYTKLPESYLTFKIQENLKIIFLGIQRSCSRGCCKQRDCWLYYYFWYYYLLVVRTMITSIITIITAPLCVVFSEVELGQQHFRSHEPLRSSMNAVLGLTAPT